MGNQEAAAEVEATPSVAGDGTNGARLSRVSLHFFWLLLLLFGALVSYVFNYETQRAYRLVHRI